MADDESVSVMLAKLEALSSSREREDALIAQRTMWLMLAQSFLFGTFAIANNQRVNNGNRVPDEVANGLVYLIPTLALAVAVLVGFAVGAGAYMHWIWSSALHTMCQTPQANALEWPLRLPASRTLLLMGQLPPLLLPLVFIVAWLVVLRWVH
jgi:hypothetical protein